MRPGFGVRGSVFGGLAVIAMLSLASSQVQDDRYQRFSAAYASLDGAKVSALYTENALYLGPGDDIVRGRLAIRERFESSFKPIREHKHMRKIAFQVLDRTDGGNVRADVGYYTITTTTPEGHTESFRGKFSKVWRRDADGVWRIHSDSYSQAPLPNPSPWSLP